MEDVLISIIVPVYNVEKYLSRCIKSIIKQTYKNLEIILVDDGSKDSSGCICDTFAEKDSRIKVIHNENMGVSAARNIGVDCANGALLMFVDSDDWLKKDAVESLYSLQKTDDADLCVGNVVKISHINYEYSTMGDNQFTKDETDKYLMFLDKTGILFSPVAKLYKTEIIRDNQIKYDREMTTHEDLLFILNYIEKCMSFITTSRPIYVYNGLNENSSSKKHHENNNLWAKKCAIAYERIFLDANDKKIKEHINNYWIRRCYYSIYHYTLRIDDVNKSFKKIRETWEIFKDNISFDMDCSDVKIIAQKNTLLKYLPQENYEGIYSEIRTGEINGIEGKLKKFVKKTLIKCKKILYRL